MVPILPHTLMVNVTGDNTLAPKGQLGSTRVSRCRNC